MITWFPGMTIDQIEEAIIKKAIPHYGDKTTAANALGIARRTLDYKLEKYAEEEKVRQALAEQQQRKDEEFLRRCRGLPPLEVVTEEVIMEQVATSSIEITTLKSKKK